MVANFHSNVCQQHSENLQLSMRFLQPNFRSGNNTELAEPPLPSLLSWSWCPFAAKVRWEFRTESDVRRGEQKFISYERKLKLKLHFTGHGRGWKKERNGSNALCKKAEFRNLRVDSEAFLYTHTWLDLATKIIIIIIIMSNSSYYDYHYAEINYDI